MLICRIFAKYLCVYCQAKIFLLIALIKINVLVVSLPQGVILLLTTFLNMRFGVLGFEKNKENKKKKAHKIR